MSNVLLFQLVHQEAPTETGWGLIVKRWEKLLCNNALPLTANKVMLLGCCLENGLMTCDDNSFIEKLYQAALLQSDVPYALGRLIGRWSRGVLLQDPAELMTLLKDPDHQRDAVYAHLCLLCSQENALNAYLDKLRAAQDNDSVRILMLFQKAYNHEYESPPIGSSATI